MRPVPAPVGGQRLDEHQPSPALAGRAARPGLRRCRVYIETMTSNLYVENDAAVYRHTLAFDHLRALALGPQDSTAFIARLAE